MLYTPSLPSVTSDSESLRLKITRMTEIAALASDIQSCRVEADVNLLFLMHSPKTPPTYSLEWYVLMLTAVETVLTLHTIYLLFHSNICRILKWFEPRTRQEVTTLDALEQNLPTTQPTTACVIGKKNPHSNKVSSNTLH
jgi:hypothetical protein